LHATWGGMRDMWLPGHACLLGIAAPLMIMRSRQSLGTNASVLKCAAIVSSKTASAPEAMLAIPGVDCEAALHSQHISASCPNTAGGARRRISAVGQGYLASVNREPLKAVWRVKQNSGRKGEDSLCRARAFEGVFRRSEIQRLRKLKTRSLC